MWKVLLKGRVFQIGLVVSQFTAACHSFPIITRKVGFSPVPRITTSYTLRKPT